MRTCTVQDCAKKYLAKGMCSMHYARVRNHGSVKPTRAFDGRYSEYLHHIYRGMLYRCRNTDDPAYGARGITVCSRWLGIDGYLQFKKDMGDYPGKPYSIDRIDSNGNYEPANCRWATPKEQVINRRMFKNNTAGRTGVYWSRRDRRWIALLGHNYKIIYLGSFASKEDAITARGKAETTHHREVLV